MSRKTPHHRPPSAAPMIRLQRALAQAGFGSRRQCEALIVEGRVEVDGRTVDRLGTRVDPNKQKILVDGSLARPTKLQYFAVHKPPGVVSTCRDPVGRTRVIDLINTDQRVYNVGRLDKSSEGLILVTNDGDLANRLTHPRFGIDKTYLVTVVGHPPVADLNKLTRGVYIAEGFARVSQIRLKKRRRQSTELKIVLNEGRNREIRRLLAHIGHKVIRLRRIAIGPLHLSDLPVGAHRRLERSEIEALRHASSPNRSAVRVKPSARISRSSSRKPASVRRDGRAESAGPKVRTPNRKTIESKSGSAKSKRAGGVKVIGAPVSKRKKNARSKGGRKRSIR